MKKKLIIQFIQIAAIAGVAACGGGNDPVAGNDATTPGNNDSVPAPSPSPNPAPAPKQFPIRAFKDGFVDQGAVWTMSGQFNNGGKTEQHSQQFNLAPGVANIDWQGGSNLIRSDLVVRRTINGAPGPDERNSIYYKSNRELFGKDNLTSGETSTVHTGGGVLPQSASIGERGTLGTSTLVYGPDRSAQIGSEYASWEVTAGPGANPLYCEVFAVTDTQNDPRWEYKWCYGMTDSGQSDGYISYEYSVASGNNGKLEGSDLSFGGGVVSRAGPFAAGIPTNLDATPTQCRKIRISTLQDNAVTLDTGVFDSEYYVRNGQVLADVQAGNSDEFNDGLFTSSDGPDYAYCSVPSEALVLSRLDPDRLTVRDDGTIVFSTPPASTVLRKTKADDGSSLYEWNLVSVHGLRRNRSLSIGPTGEFQSCQTYLSVGTVIEVQQCGDGLDEMVEQATK